MPERERPMAVASDFRDTTLEVWLCEQFAKWLGREPSDIDASTNFADYGLDSIGAVTMSADLEEAVGVPLEGSILWEYPTINRLSKHLREEMKRLGIAFRAASGSK
jgi:acyl carrier protein